MSSIDRRYKFISPGVFIDEIDNSQRPRAPAPVGPAIIGRTERGPALKPITVSSFSEFIEAFGNPVAGGSSDDVWRNGNYTSPTYAAYAAQAWLKNSSTATVVRLLGAEHGGATAAGKAGWQTTALTDAGASSGGGAYGLFISTNTAGSGPNTTRETGALAAIFYCNEGCFELSGAIRNPYEKSGGLGDLSATGTCAMIQNVGSNYEYIGQIKNGAGTLQLKTNFNFNPNSEKYIRKVFNTNPVKTNADINSSTVTYWLGETFDNWMDSQLKEYSTATTGSTVGFVVGLLASGSGVTGDQAKHRHGMKDSTTGWVFSQDISTNSGSWTSTAVGVALESVQNLFYFKTMDSGEATQRKYKISIEDIRPSSNNTDPYGSFSVSVRLATDTDNAPKVVEKFSSCNLNPNSNNYVAKKIGTEYRTWDDTNRKYTIKGEYPGRSNFIRVVMNEDVDSGYHDTQCLPFGCYGPKTIIPFAVCSASNGVAYEYPSSPLVYTATGALNVSDELWKTKELEDAAYVKGADSIMNSYAKSGEAGIGPVFVHLGYGSLTASMYFPELGLREDSKSGSLANPKSAYWGATYNKYNSNQHDPSFVDTIKYINHKDSITTGLLEDSWIFTLDDLMISSSHGYWAVNKRADQKSFTTDGSGHPGVDTGTWKDLLRAGWGKFTVPLYGGDDGLDITESDPFRNSQWTGTPTDVNSYSYNSVKRAIDSIADPDEVEINAATAPGITNESLTNQLMEVCEARGDALAIIDVKGGFKPKSENANSFASRLGSIDTVVDNLQDRNLNTSYGCAYYPWVKISDSINATTLWAPPSVVALGVFSSTDMKEAPWFAPAGFTRGGLSDGAAGIPVVQVEARLTKDERDDLYLAKVNPIAQFPQEGLVIFGQKTLQAAPSALDRINVRRLMIFLKKEISRAAKSLLFDPNTKVTWNRFVGMVKPLLLSVKVRLGLEDFKLILDETTTTPDLIDQNIMYAKIILKPTRAIEFIAVDFVITDSGASFED